MEKMTIMLSAFLLMTISVFSKAHTSFAFNNMLKAPIVIEINAKHASKDDALITAKKCTACTKVYCCGWHTETNFYFNQNNRL